jgi:cation transport ATPase
VIDNDLLREFRHALETVVVQFIGGIAGPVVILVRASENWSRPLGNRPRHSVSQRAVATRAMSFSSVSVIPNALRLRWIRL